MSRNWRSSRLRYAQYLLGNRAESTAGAAAASTELKHAGWEQKGSTPISVLIKSYYSFLRGDRARVAAALTALSIATLLKFVPAAAIKITLDYVFNTGTPLPELLPSWLAFVPDRITLLLLLGGVVFVSSSLNLGLRVWSLWMVSKAMYRVENIVRRKVFRHTLGMPLDRVYGFMSGGVASVLRNDGAAVGHIVRNVLYTPLQTIIQVVGCIAALLWVAPWLFVGALIAFPAIFIAHRNWVHVIRPIRRDIRQQWQEVDSHVTEVVSGIRVVRTYGRKQSEVGRYSADNHLMTRMQFRAFWWGQLAAGIWGTAIPAATAVLLVYGGALVLSGALTAGDLMMFLFFMAMLLNPLSSLSSDVAVVQNELAALERVTALLAEPLESGPRSHARTIDRDRAECRLTLSNVSFRYPEADDVVLHDINLVIEPEQTIALVGSSGAGKTTLCNLIAHFYDPTSGDIEIDGVNLKDINPDSYRTLLGIVEQDVFLFAGTVAENIAYSSRDATMAGVRRAAELATADDFISRLPDGYETYIGERGVRLSGGQRQRLAIARAILAEPRILILDEATSNLDTQSELLIQQSQLTLASGRTCVIVAHRLSTITHVDRILVMERGHIVEQGTHDELMSRDTRYREMVRLQTHTETESFA